MSYYSHLLKRKSTYQGVLMLLGGIHYWYNSLTFDEFIGGFMICTGLIEIFIPENIDKK